MAKQWKQWDTLFWGGSKITADYDCSHEIKRCLFLGRKVMTNLDSLLKSRNITFPIRVHLVKTMVFPVVMYGCEGWTIRKAGCWRTDTFELWCWRRHLRVHNQDWGRNINNLKYADDTTLTVKSEELKSLLMKVKEESEKFGLKLNIQKMKIMASSPITSWQIDGETMARETDFSWGGLQNHCRLWLQPWN